MEIGTFATVVGTGIASVGLIYQIVRNFKNDINSKFEAMERRLDKSDSRFEKIDQRLFLLALGKDLPSILKSEREKDQGDE